MTFWNNAIKWTPFPENLIWVHENNKGADQHVHPLSLISDFDIHYLKSSNTNLATGKYFNILASLYSSSSWFDLPGRVAQSVTCLATDACLTADPGVTSSIPVRSHTFVEIDHEIISTVILLPSTDLFKKGCCQLQAKVCARITG